MSIPKDSKELNNHKNMSIAKLDAYITSLINSNNPKLQSKADKLCYWLSDWTTFLDFEPSFSPASLRRYKRGEIIKVHLGFNVGSEEGGLHYAVVVEKNNPKSSPVVTVVPLTSVKPTTDLTKLKPGSVFLGNELFTKLNLKIVTTQKRVNQEILSLQSLQQQTDYNLPESSTVIQDIVNRIESCQNEIEFMNKMHDEVIKMKKGSIALVNQITTISKIRIYDPKTDHDILSNIRLSNEKLDMLDNLVKSRYTNY